MNDRAPPHSPPPAAHPLRRLRALRLAWALGLPAGCYGPSAPLPEDPVGGSGVEDRDGDGSPAKDDCDDNHAGVRPGAVEVCDGIDNDCDGLIDDADTNINRFTQQHLYRDQDGDGFGYGREDRYACTPQVGWANNDVDCDDANPAVHPRAQEVCNGIDDDCDGLRDDLDPSVDLETARPWFDDRDEDGFGEPGTGTLACAPPDRRADNALDCDDRNPDSYPGAPELCDGEDNDCDGLLDLASESLDACPVTVADLTIEGSREGDQAGASVAWVGDLDGLGGADLAIGAPGSDGRGADIGLVAIFGAPLPIAAQTGRAELRFLGDVSGDRLGPLAGLGDMNGDGYDDLVMQSPGADHGGPDQGQLYVAYGPLREAAVVNALPARIVGLSEGGRALPMAGPGDTTGDGLAELLVSDPLFDVGARDGGAVWLFAGPVSSLNTAASAQARLLGGTPGMQLGTLASGRVDINGDGVYDIILGAPGDPSGAADGGAVYLWTHPPVGEVRSEDADLQLNGTVVAGRAGAAVAGLADQDGDGMDDLLVGAPGTSAGRGRAYLLCDPLRKTDLWGAAATVEGEAPGDQLGETLAAIGDLSGEGEASFAVGAPKVAEGAGAVWIFSGGLAGAVPLSAARATLSGAAAGDAVGSSLAGVGDVDSDGHDDLLIGAPGREGDRSTEVDLGAAYFFSGISL